jgi:cytidyltransferase-like protein
VTPDIVLSREQLLNRVRAARAEGRTIALANGCFDILHVGHVRYLESAAREADVLVVALNDDASVRQLKGEGRPILPASDRAELVYGLATGADVRLGLYDGAGRLVRELATGRESAGEHRVSVDVTDLSAGVYHCRLTAGGVELMQTLIVVK